MLSAVITILLINRILLNFTIFVFLARWELFVLEKTFKKINSVISKVSGSSFTKKEIDDIAGEIKDILISADVPYDYVSSLVKNLKNKMNSIVEKKVNKSAVIGGILQNYVYETFMNSKGNGISIKKNGITTIGVFGTNGVGKTSNVVKLAKLLCKKYHKQAMCVSFDTTRYAAQEQLKVLCGENDIGYMQIVENGIEEGIKKLAEIVDYEVVDILIVDFAGISPDNVEGAKIWKQVIERINFDERIVVLDGTFGQNTIRLIEGFNKIVKITGFIVSKLDSDQKGGVFFSIRTASNKPIYYVSTGEKIGDIVAFNKEMIGNALFADGGLKSIISSFQESNREYIQSIIHRTKNKQLTYNDLLVQLMQIVEFGKIDKVLSVLPHTKNVFNVKLSTDAYILIKKWISIINSMTSYERATPSIISIDRINRIAKGSGVEAGDVITLKKKLEEINNEMS